MSEFKPADLIVAARDLTVIDFYPLGLDNFGDADVLVEKGAYGEVVEDGYSVGLCVEFRSLPNSQWSVNPDMIALNPNVCQKCGGPWAVHNGDGSCAGDSDWANDPDYFEWTEAQDAEYERFMMLDDLYRDERPLAPITYNRRPDGSGYIDLPF